MGNPTTVEKDVLKHFTGVDWGSRKLSQTWVVAGHEWATNGQIAVGIRTDAQPTSAEGFPLVSALLAIDIPLPEPIPITMPPKGATGSCDVCRGGRYEVEAEQCTECDGTGIVECPHCHAETDCEACEGRGHRRKPTDRPCDECGGDGKGWESVQYGDRYFTGRHLAMIARHLPNPVCVGIGALGQMVFHFDGGTGLLMCKMRFFSP